jgi:beta-lactamase class A
MLLYFVLAAQLDTAQLRKDLAAIEKTIDARLGVCVQTKTALACNRPAERFSLQSVMKLQGSMLALDAVDRGKWTLDTKIHFTKKDLSAFMQPIEKRLGPNGADVSVGDLIRSAIIESDSAAVDILLDNLGGPAAVNALLRTWKIEGMSIDRTERDLQAEIVGLQWKTEYGDVPTFRAAIAKVSPSARAEAYAKYQKDARDTSTPRAMTQLLRLIAEKKLFQAATQAFLERAMFDTATGVDRLKAGLAPGWSLMHKTGTAGSWQGVAAATNDVGILTAPDGERIAVAVFVGDSKSSDEANARAIAEVARAIARRYSAAQSQKSK